MLRIGSDPSDNQVSSINIRQDNERVGVLKNPDGRYSLDVSGSINCNVLLVNGSVFEGGSGSAWTQDDTTGDISYNDGNVFVGTGLDVSGYLKVPFGSSDISSSTYEGYIRYNDVSYEFQGYDVCNNVWGSLGSGTGGGVWTQDASGDISYGDGNVSISGDLHVIGDISGYIHVDQNSYSSTTLVSYSSTSSSLAGVWTQDDTTGDISYGDGNVFIGAGLDVSGYLKLPFGSDDVSSATYEGYIRYNDASNVYQGYDASNNVWSSLGEGSTFDSITESAEPLYNYLRIYREDYTGNDIILNGLQVWDNSVNLISSGIDSSVNFYDSSGGTTITQAVGDEFGDVSDVVDASTSTIGSYAQIAFTSPLPNYNDLQAIYMVSPNTTDYELSGCKVQLLTSQETILAESDVLGSSANYLLRGPVAITSSASSASSSVDISYTLTFTNTIHGDGYTVGWAIHYIALRDTTGISYEFTSAEASSTYSNSYLPEYALTDNGPYFHSNPNVETTNSGWWRTTFALPSQYTGALEVYARGGSFQQDATIVITDNNDNVVNTYTYDAGTGNEITFPLFPDVPMLFSSPSDIVAWSDFSTQVDDVSLNEGSNLDGSTITIDGDLNVTSVLYVSGNITTNGDINVDGTAYASGSALTSDDRLKHNEEDISGLELITQLHPQKYLKTRLMYAENYALTEDASGEYTNLKQGDRVDEEMGIIAQDVLNIPELSFCVTDSTPYAVNYNNLFVLSIQAIKELKAEKDALQTTITQLTSRIEALENASTT